MDQAGLHRPLMPLPYPSRLLTLVGGAGVGFTHTPWGWVLGGGAVWKGGVGGEGVVTRMSTAHESHEAHLQHVDPEAKQDALKRLNYIDGHLDGIRRMVEQDKYCVDILKQSFAVRRAIQKMEMTLLEGHLHSCVIDGVRGGREEQVLEELLELYALSDRR